MFICPVYPDNNNCVHHNLALPACILYTTITVTYFLFVRFLTKGGTLTNAKEPLRTAYEPFYQLIN